MNELRLRKTEVRVPWRQSLRTRLMLWFGLLVGLLLLLGFTVAYVAAQRQLVAEAEARTRFEARQASDRLQATLDSVRITVEGVAGLQQRLTLDRDEWIAAMEAMVAADVSAVGGLLALEPGVLPDGEALAHYVGSDVHGVANRDMLADGYDVQAQGWYQATLAAQGPWWSDPYFNETAGGTWMTTLNLPLRDSSGRGIGMVSLDVPVRRLSELLDGLRAEPGQRPTLLSPGGSIAVHPDPGVALNLDFETYVRENGRDDLAAVVQAHAARQHLQFEHELPGLGERRYSVLEPIGASGWSLHLALSHDAILADLRRQGLWLALGASVATLVVAVLVRRLARRITVPLSELTGSAGHFAAGEYDWPVPHDTRGDEVGVMARALERARDSIRFQLDEIAGLATERQKLESELDIARDIQLAMLPPPREVRAAGARVEVGAVLKPAKAVGGDFYNFFEQTDGGLWFVVGDVSDKGVPAALFMARTMTVLEVAAKLGGTPARALAEAALHLVEGNDTCMFATVLCGRLDLATGELALANAGHEAPALLRAGQAPAWLALPGGPPLGFEAGQAYEAWHGRLDPGDALVLYTDGVTEAFNRDDLAFGEQRLLDTLSGELDASAQCEAILAAVQGHAGEAPQSDDITVMVLRRHRDIQGG
ncbi:SpoIIE family protein phosphatase [Arenimonas aestuarii]